MGPGRAAVVRQGAQNGVGVLQVRRLTKTAVRAALQIVAPGCNRRIAVVGTRLEPVVSDDAVLDVNCARWS